MKRKKKLLLRCGVGLGSCLCLGAYGPSAWASQQVPQTAVPGSCIPQFAAPLAVFGPAGPIPRVDAAKHPYLTVKMREVDQDVLTGLTDTCGFGLTFGKTRVWGYEISDTVTGALYGPTHWPAVTVEAKRYTPAYMTYVNELPAFRATDPYGLTGLLQGIVSNDKTIDFGPSMLFPQAMGPCSDNPAGTDLDGTPCSVSYLADPPAVVHLHGGEVPAASDGGPQGWFTSSGRKGKDFTTLRDLGPGKALYQYPNAQEAGTLWFHDHVMGATRTNVYSGLAAFYFLRDSAREPRSLPSGAREIEIAIQDRQFDTTGQLYFPDGTGTDASVSNLNGTPPNPSIHPLWIPEFIGDVAVANGVPWPYFNVDPARYRFRLIEGSNARFYNLRFVDASGAAAPMYQIGSDGNYLNAPARLDSLFIAPGERADIIVDFTNFAGKTVTVTNDAPVPYPMGLSPVPHPDPVTGNTLPADQPQMASIMQFTVGATAVADTSCNPAAGGCKRPTPMVRLADGKGAIASGVRIDKIRRLTLKEQEGPGGPIKVLVNNTNFYGSLSPNIANQFPGVEGISELPRQGSTELWEIVNLTVDAHPMHTHLVQFQILNRQPFSDAYLPVWAAAYGAPGSLPASCNGISPLNPCPGYGPPLPYDNGGEVKNLPNGQTNVPVVGGNPSEDPYLVGPATPPTPGESGWKDTAKALPGQVLRMLVRFTPSSVAVKQNGTYAGQNLYPFDPTAAPGYVWHCHIVDHEDQDMMRPYSVTK